MTDTGQVPGEGLPENAGMVEQPGVPAPGAYTFLDPSDPSGNATESALEDDDLLLMPASQGAWSDPQVVPAQAAPLASAPHLAETAVHFADAAPQYAQAAQHLAGAAPQLVESGAHEAGGRDSGSVDFSGVRMPPPPASTAAPTPPPARRPLHMGPPVPDASGGVVRSLADRGPAAVQNPAGPAQNPVQAPVQGSAQTPGQFPTPVPTRHAGPPTTGPEYLDIPGAQTALLPGPQLGEIPSQGPTSWTPQPQAQAAPEQAPTQAPQVQTVPVPAQVAQAPAAQVAQAPAPAPAAEIVSPQPQPQPSQSQQHQGSQGSVAETVVPEQIIPEAVAPASAPEAVAPEGAVPEVAAPDGIVSDAVVVPPVSAPEGAPESAAPAPEQTAPEQTAPEAPAADGPAPDQAAAEAAAPAPVAAVAAAPEPVGPEPVLQPGPAHATPAAPVPAQAPAGLQATPPVGQFVQVEGSVPVGAQLAPAPAPPVPAVTEPAAAPAQAAAPVVAVVPEQELGAVPVPAEPAPATLPEPAAAPTAPAEAAPGPDASAQPVPEAAAVPEEPVQSAPAEAEAETSPEPVVAQAEPAAAPAATTPAVPAEQPATVPAPRDSGPAVPATPLPQQAADEAETAEVIETAEVTETAEVIETAEAVATQAEPAQTEPAQAEPVQAGAADAEPVQEEPVQAETPAAETDPAPEQPAPETVAVEVPAAPAAPGYDDAEREAVLRVMRERRDIRNGFRSDPIPHEVLLRVLEAAHHAPSVGHSQPWDFVVIRSAETRRAMHELAARQRDAYAKSLPKARAKQFKELKIEAILDTPVNIVVTADPTRGGRHTLGRHTQPQMAPYSSALAVENLWLAARAEGLGVGWVSFFDEREMVRALGLPEHLEVVAYLCVGYVDEFPEEPELLQAGWSKRRPLSWVVHEETYGRRALPGEEPHDLLQETITNIRPLDAKALGEAWERQKRMTKPAGALGMLEIISAQLSGLSRACPPPIPEPAAVAIFAGDHGVHAQGVTAWPQEVTMQMVANFLGGGAVCNAFANQVGAEVCVIDVGVAGELPATPGLLPRKVRAGTADFTTGPALTREEVLSAIEVGIETARDLVTAGNKALLTGEMGIANTTVSAALICVYTGQDPAEVTGRGTGINDEMHARKVDVVRRALDLHKPDPADPIGVLAAVGGLEHAALVGFLLGGASLRTPVILDGVSAGAAALVARAVAPEALAACIAGHRSAEPGHVAALNKLGLRPLVDLDLRLGEGTGALLALPVVQSAARAMHEVATFDSAGVTEK
ncbi:nicotinate-nucleotide--dimethylbenzimidazole phosphoribosyltransferase [Streptomyces sp. NPDC048442]|uniref:nicotinate-nucleotide--dimethylbenzimidazole phosphoribosyltransferase n=1 Tax=Streptomyces sp. NPDC048442 TaxID=3154823 RepID=UPI003441AAA7